MSRLAAQGYRELQKLLTDRTYTPIGIWWLCGPESANKTVTDSPVHQWLGFHNGWVSFCSFDFIPVLLRPRWRCFDGYNDQHARAAVVAITFRDRFFLVDILKLEA